MSQNRLCAVDDHYTAVIDRWLPILDHYELRCLLYILRHTTGRSKASDSIALRQFVQGIVRQDGIRQDGGTGLDARSVRRGLKGLEKRGIIRVLRTKLPGTHANATNVYILTLERDAALLGATDDALSQTDPWCENDPTSDGERASETSVEVGAEMHQTKEKEEIKKERTRENTPEPSEPDEQSRESDAPCNDRHIPLPSLDQWWLSVVAAHNRQRPRTHLTDTDAATLSRWRSLGASDAFIRQVLEERLRADIDRRIYALAYCDHSLRAALTGQKRALPKVANSGRGSFRFGMHPSDPEAGKAEGVKDGRVACPVLSLPGEDGEKQGQLQEETIGHIPLEDDTMLSTPRSSSSASVPPDTTTACHPAVPPSTACIHCTKCFHTFSRAQDDPCLQSMSLSQRRTWSGEHIACYHRELGSGNHLSTGDILSRGEPHI